MERFSSLQIGAAIGVACLVAGTAAYLLYKRSGGKSLFGGSTLRDPYFKTENIALYSTEAAKRAEQLS